MRVVPGSHPKKQLYNHLREDREDLVLTQRITRTLDESRAADIELDPGQMSLHDIYMIHGATVNARRCGAPASPFATCRGLRCSREI